jgi:hypothetical protein
MSIFAWHKLIMGLPLEKADWLKRLLVKPLCFPFRKGARSNIAPPRGKMLINQKKRNFKPEH